MNLDHLGTPLAPMTRVRGGGTNRVYRLDTDQGSFAVKELNPDRGWTYHHADVFRLEQAAHRAGIPMPEPISADHEVLVHRWVDGDKVPEEPVTLAFAAEIGEILARLHALDVEWSHLPITVPMATDWADLARRAESTGQPWADALADRVELFLAMSRFVDECDRASPVVLTHKDITPRNVLARGGRPVVLDWEVAGTLDLASELGSTALNLAKGAGFDTVEPGVFRAILDGYRAAGGTLPPSGPHWFGYFMSGWMWFTRWNIRRCIAGVEATTGPELALSNEEARAGLLGLPELFECLPQLESLLP